jgi:hypothetical protein
MDVSIGATGVCLERKKPTPEEMANIATQGAGAVGAAEDHSRDRRPAEETGQGRWWVPE